MSALNTVLKACKIVTCQKRENLNALEHARERASAKGSTFSFNMGGMKYPCACRRMKLPGRDAHSEKVRDTLWQKMRQRRSCDRQLTV